MMQGNTVSVWIFFFYLMHSNSLEVDNKNQFFVVN